MIENALEKRKDVTFFYSLISPLPRPIFSPVPSLIGLGGGNSILNTIVGKFFFILALKRLALAIARKGTISSVEMAGMGLGNTFLVTFKSGEKLAVRVKNELREKQIQQFWEEREAFLADSAEERFCNEAATLGILSKKGLSPKVITVTSEYVCTEFIEGESTFSLALRDSLSVTQLEAVFSSIKKMHALGVVHADSNPANALIVGQQIRFLDFEKRYNPNVIKPEDFQLVDLAMFFERFNQYASDYFRKNQPLFTAAVVNSYGKDVLHSLVVVMRRYPVIFRRATDKLLEAEK